jgi:hypothetical protein
MCSLEELSWVEGLVRAGLNDCAIARLTGLPRTTVRDWRQTQRWVPRKWPARAAPLGESCAECGHPIHRFDELGPPYVYLLGLYLGDGYIVRHGRGVYRLTVTLDARYPGVVAECTRPARSTSAGLSLRTGRSESSNDTRASCSAG